MQIDVFLFLSGSSGAMAAKINHRSMYKCIIVDDEPHAIEGLRGYINGIPELEILRTYTEPADALFDIIAGPDVDLIFLDVCMQGISGLEIAKEVRQKTKKLVFTTAHAKYGYDAFELGVDAFLLKPYSFVKFMVAYNKLFPKPAVIAEKDKADFLFIKSKEHDLKLMKIRIRDIIAVESKLNYIQIYTINSQIMTYISLSEFSKTLMKFDGFHQFQRSFILAENYIEYIEGNSIKMINGTRISVGTFYKKTFHDFVETRLVKASRKR